MSALKRFTLPDVGEGLTEAELVEWKVKVGDTVKINDVLVEIETAKSLVELPSPYAGVVAELLVVEGQTVEVGSPIIAIDEAASTAGGDPGVAAPMSGAEPAPVAGSLAEDLVPTPKDDEPIEPGLIGGPAPGGRTSVLVGYGPRTTDAKRRPRRSATPVEVSPAAAQAGVQHSFTPHATPPPAVAIEDAPPAVPAEAVAEPTAAVPSLRSLAKPPVRKLAKDSGIDLTSVTGTGEGGRITRQDVENMIAGPVAADLEAAGAAGLSGSAGPAQDSSGAERRIPVKGVRKLTAQAMVTSAFTAPHVTAWVTVDATGTMKLVRQLRASRDFADVKVSPLLIVSRAVCLALRRTPELNATWDEDAQEIVLKSYVNLGIAAATPRGLLVPNIKGAEGQSLVQLAGQLAELTSVARAGKTPPADTAGGTFTITNVGVFGVDGGTPILNPGESGILCVGAIRRQPWVVGKRIRPRWITTLSVSFDHRIADGQQGSTFLSDVASIINDPAKALLF